MEEKYRLLPCLQIPSDLRSATRQWTLRNVSQHLSVIIRSCHNPRTAFSLQDVPNGFNAPLHECLWNVHAHELWRNSGITKVDHKKHVIWGNAHITFFLSLSIFLSRQSPSHCSASATGVGQTQRWTGWRWPGLMGAGHVPAVLAPPAGTISSYFSKLLGKYISFKRRHRNHASKEC